MKHLLLVLTLCFASIAMAGNITCPYCGSDECGGVELQRLTLEITAMQTEMEAMEDGEEKEKLKRKHEAKMLQLMIAVLMNSIGGNGAVGVALQMNFEDKGVSQ